YDVDLVIVRLIITWFVPASSAIAVALNDSLPCRSRRSTQRVSAVGRGCTRQCAGSAGHLICHSRQGCQPAVVSRAVYLSVLIVPYLKGRSWRGVSAAEPPRCSSVLPANCRRTSSLIALGSATLTLTGTPTRRRQRPIRTPL